MRFKITCHSGYSPPEDALDRLLERLGPRREDVSFTKVGAEIKAMLDEDAPVSMTRDERVDIGRRGVLAVVTDTCESTPGLRSDWFAVSFEA